MTTHLIFDELVGIVFETRVCCNSHTIVDILRIMHSSLVSQPVCHANGRVGHSQRTQASYKIKESLNIW